MAAEKYHIMMFPWVAFGHMIPFLELSKRLAAKGILVSYISTPKNIQRLPPIPSHLQPKINLVEIPMPPVEGLPENCEATIDLPENQIQYLKKAYDNLAEPFENLLQETKPDLIILDFAPYRISQVATKFCIKTALFSVFTAATLSYVGPPGELKTGKRRVTFEQYTKPTVDLHVPDASGKSTGGRIAKIIEESSFVVVRSCHEFEGEYLRLVEELYDRPVLPIGVLPPIPEEKKNNVAINSSWLNAKRWLDGQNQKSVVFVGFGSEYKMPIEQIHELAFSLELSRLPFIWILRKPQDVENSSELLPPGFSDRTLNQGVVLLGWGPTAGNSRSSCDRRMPFPLWLGNDYRVAWIWTSIGSSSDGLNAKLLVEKEVGYEVPRNEDGSFSRDVVAESIRRVMVEPEGQQLRTKAADMRSIFGDHKRHDNYIDKFIEYLEEMKREVAKHKISQILRRATSEYIF
ncbi:hypothetical protein DH2020_024010 [Rehmannia glutinosa]|uniref:UDP-glycosyltransferase n=1 Tax=Rehmannia glutinosa TaxID=99300 RepID=A0ABR0W8F2_REHGL